MSLKVYVAGKYVDKADAKVSVYDHGFLYGDGVFEGLRSYAGRVFRLGEHLDRLWESAKAIWLTIPMTKEALAAVVVETLRINDIRDGYVRLVVSRGAGSLGLDPTKTSDPQVVVIADHISLYPKEMYEKGLEIVTAATVRNHPNALSPRIKSLNYLNNILAKIEALQAGAVEALMLNTKGEVAECTGDNIFLIRGKTLLTPPIDAGILDGVTRRAAMELAAGMGLAVKEIPLVRHDVYIADEVFLTGTAAEVIPVVRVDLRTIGDGKPGPVTLELTRRFHELTRSEG